MAESDKEAQYKQEFIDRVRAARVGTSMKQWQVAQAIGIPQDHYKHYEVRGKKGRLMPHHLIAQFCIVCRVNLEWLVAGKGKKAWQPLTIAGADSPPLPAPAKPVPQRAPRRRTKKAA